MTVIIIQLGVCSTLLCAQMVPESERDRPCAHAASPKAGAHSPLPPASGPLLPRQGPKLFLRRVFVSEETEGRERKSGKPGHGGVGAK